MTDWVKKLGGMQSEHFQKNMHDARLISLQLDDTPRGAKYEYYDEYVAVRNATAYAFALQKVALEDHARLRDLEQPIRNLAEMWENLAGQRDNTDDIALMNAAVCYRLAGYQASAACIAKKIPETSKGKSLEHISSLFLQGRLLDLRRMCYKILDPPHMYKNKTDAVAGLGLEGAARGYLGAVEYLLSGSESGLKGSDDILALANSAFSDHAMLKEWSLTAMTRSLLKPMTENSTWNVLGTILENNRMWRRYLMLLARGPGTPVSETASVSEIWPSQRTAIESGLFDAENAIIAMPTGAGKTRIAEMAMVHTMAQDPAAKCIYVAPYRALVAELEDNFLNVLADLGLHMSAFDGAFEDDPLQRGPDDYARIMIMTPEKLDLLLRSQPNLLEHVKLFIIDEAHLVEGGGGRGTSIELLLARLKRKMQGSRFLFLSAVFSQSLLDEYASWFKCKKISNKWRPSANHHARFEWKGNEGVMTYEGLEDLPMLTKKEYTEVNKTTGRSKRRVFPPDSKAGTAAALALKFFRRGSVLIFATQRTYVMPIAEALQKGLECGYLSEQQMLFELSHGKRSLVVAEAWLGPDHPVTRLLKTGIAVHHGGIPDILRRYIEDDFRRGKFGIMVATSTLAQGVNLPVRTVIIHSCRRYLEKKMSLIPVAEYWNAAGRAGRAGHETSGTTIHIVHTTRDQTDYNWYCERRENGENIKGDLFRILEQLKDDRLSSDWADERVDSQILAMLAEEDDCEMSAGRMQDILDASLVSLQAKNEGLDVGVLVDKFEEKAAEIGSVVDSGRLWTYSATGLRSQSCVILKEFAEEHELLLRDSFADPNAEKVDELLRESINALGRIDEMQPIHQFGGDTLDLLERWMSGSYPDVRRTTGHNSTNGVDPITTSMFVEEYFGRLLPWGLSSLLRVSRDVLGLDGNDTPDEIRYLPIMIKYGVSTCEAGWCMAAGIPFRWLAAKISERYVSTHDTSDYAEFMEWFSTLDGDFFMKLDLDEFFIGDVLRAVSRHGRNPLLGRAPADYFLREPIRLELATTYRCRVGDTLELKREDDNRYDRNAITIRNLDKRVLGPLERNVAQVVAPHIDCGARLSAVVEEMSDGIITRIRLVETTSGG